MPGDLTVVARHDRICAGAYPTAAYARPSEYLRDIYYDTMVFRPEGVRHLAAEVGAGQLMVGTDYPFPWTDTAIDLILETPGLSDEEKVAILGGTAMRLLGIDG